MSLKDIAPIHCIGDSHISVFGGTNIISEGCPSKYDEHPYFKTYRVGPALAYNLITPEHSFKQVFMQILRHIPPNSWILTSFGEIDCRAHLIRQSEKQNRSIEAVVHECVNRYFKFIKEIQNLGYHIIVYAAPPTCNVDVLQNPDDDNKYPYYGTYIHRNYTTKIFNMYLNSLCDSKNIFFLSIFDQLVSSDGKTSDSQFFSDLVHLSAQTALPLLIDELEKILG